MSWEQHDLQTVNLEQKGIERYNLSKDKRNYCNINPWWIEPGKYLMSKMKFIASKNKGLPFLLLAIHCPTETSRIKAQKISLLIKLHVINMQLYQKWTSPPRPQETIINKNRFTKTKICMETPFNWNSLRIEAKKINLLPQDTSPYRKVFLNRPKKWFPNS